MSRLSYDPTHCTLCPRRCGGDRTRAKGYCRMPDRPVVARAALHFWEEPPLSGTRGKIAHIGYLIQVTEEQ